MTNQAVKRMIAPSPLSWALAGALIAYFIFHPFIMISAYIMSPKFPGWAHVLERTFAPGMLPWGIGYGLLGALAGWLLATHLKARRKAEQALRDSESFYRQTLDSIPGMVFISRPDGRFEYQSPQWAEFTGAYVDEHLGSGWKNVLHPEDQPHELSAWKDAMQGEKPYDVEYRVRRRDGDYEWFKAIARPIHDNEGRTIRWFGVAMNIESLKQAEKEVQLAYSRLKVFFDRRIDGIGIVIGNSKGRILHANDYFLKLVGWGRTIFEARPLHLVDFTPPEWLKVNTAMWTQLQERGVSDLLEKEYARPDGTRVPVLIASAMMPGDSEEILAFVIDISARKKAELELYHLNRTLEQKVEERTALAHARSQQLQALAIQLIEAEEKERQQIALMLHDDLQQLLAGAKMQLEAYCEKATCETLESIRGILVEAIAKSRSLSHELNPPVLSSGIASALRWLARESKDRFGLTIEMKVEEVDLADASIRKFVFRAARELLFNVVKHADVARADIDLSCSGSRLVLVVSDRGKGFDPTALSNGQSSGLGLLSLQERAIYLGGKFHIESARGQGSRITLTLPANGCCETA